MRVPMESRITCYFCFETFSALLEVDPSFTGTLTEVYDCEVCCNPNKLTLSVSEGYVSFVEIDNGND